MKNVTKNWSDKTEEDNQFIQNEKIFFERKDTNR